MTIATELAQYRCHKEVHAGEITYIEPSDANDPASTMILHVRDSNGGVVEKEVTAGWMQKHTPQVGGYFVTYADGYESYSPAEAFNDGYTRLEP